MNRAYAVSHQVSLARAIQPQAVWAWAMGGALLGLLAAVLLFAPARWLAQTLSQASGGHVNLVDAQGTVWQGSALLVLSGGQDSVDAMALPGRLVWRIHPRMAWPPGQIQATLNAPCCMNQPLALQARLGIFGFAQGSQITFDDHQSKWPAKLLSGLGTPWNTVQADGQLALGLHGLSLQWPDGLLGRLSLVGRLQLDALHMGSRLSTLKPMGSYRLSLQAVESGTTSASNNSGKTISQSGNSASRLTLETLQGSSLQLSGQGQWLAGRLHFEGIASALPERAEALSNLLNIIGRRDGMRSIIKLG